ncbi:MAG: uroporphyrinogen-III C-methyltransferase [Candidatus Omnitrophota bacterium]
MCKYKTQVYLVGVGPGDESLITQAGLDCIRAADVIVYDHLIPEKVLEHRKPQAKLIYVGKTPKRHTLIQAEINKLLVRQARKGRTVARLKGGDPFIFGRGGEEALALQKAGVLFDVVPGVSSGLAAAIYAGIPVTQRGISSQLMFVTGHEDPAKRTSDVDWASLAKFKGTLVVFMGMGRIDKISRALIGGGMKKSTPACVIRWGTLPKQKTLTATLDKIANKAKEKQLVNPAVIIIGEVVKLRNKLDWYEKKPLFGKKILVTRPLPFAAELSGILRKFGAQTIEYPLIELRKNNKIAPKVLINKFNACDWAVFTSVSAVNMCFEVLNSAGKDARIFGNKKIAVIGEETRNQLHRYGIRSDLMPKKFFMEGLVRAFKSVDLKGKRVFIPHSRQGRKVLCEELRKQGARVDEIFIYSVKAARAGGAKHLAEMIKKEDFDVITFTSSSCVRQFMHDMKTKKELLKKQAFAAIGPITASCLKSYGFRAEISARTFTIKGLAEEIIKYYMNKR